MSDSLFPQQDPFGDNPYPAGYTPPEGELKPRGGRLLSIEDHIDKSSRKKVDHGQRARAYFAKKGWVFTPCETTTGGVHGPVRKNDLFGFLDFVAFTPAGRTVGVQVCSQDTAGARLRKMCDSEVDSRSKRKHIDNLRTILGAGWKVLILGFERRAKVGNQEWWPVETWVTEETISAVEGRRRKVS